MGADEVGVGVVVLETGTTIEVAELETMTVVGGITVVAGGGMYVDMMV
jgi:hypothetical protein